MFQVADAIGAVDKASADRLAAWLPTAPGMFASALSHIVLRLSRNPAAQDATVKLASHVATLIATDTDIASRIEAYGTLARGVWRVSRNEATAYFHRGLDIADAIGSNDFDRTNSLLATFRRKNEQDRGFGLSRWAARQLQEQTILFGRVRGGGR